MVLVQGDAWSHKLATDGVGYANTGIITSFHVQRVKGFAGVPKQVQRQNPEIGSGQLSGLHLQEKTNWVC